MATCGWPRCRAWAAVGAAATPSVLAPSHDATRTDETDAAATLARLPQQDNRSMRLAVLF